MCCEDLELNVLSSRLLQSTIAARKVFVTGDINAKMAKEVLQQLYVLAHISDEPIVVFVSSPGGHVESGDMIYDAIRFIKPVVIVVGSGWVASAAALIFVAAEKENRFSLPNTRFLLHQPTGGFQGKAMDFDAYAKEITLMKERLNRIFSDATGQPIEKIRMDTDKDFWLSAEEAVEYGLVHKVIVHEYEMYK